MRCGRSSGSSYEPHARRTTHDARRGPDLLRWIVIHSLYQLRQAPAHDFRTAVRVAGRRRRIVQAAGDMARRDSRRDRIHRSPVRGDGVQPHCRPPHRLTQPPHARSRVTERPSDDQPGLGRRARRDARLPLGGVGAIAPVGGYVAITGAWSEPWWLLLGIALAVTCWVAGFDTFYALQDEAFDRAERLRSVVVRLGQARAIFVAKLLHGISIAALIAFGYGAGLGIAYYLGVGIGAGLIAWEHRLVRPGDLSKLNAAFFTANGIVSIVVFLGALVDRVL